MSNLSECEVNVEVIIKQNCTAKVKNILSACEEYLRRTRISSTIISTFNVPLLSENVNHLLIDLPAIENSVCINVEKANFYIYTLSALDPQIESFQDDVGGQINLATQWILPSANLYNLWENLVFDDAVKNNLLSYANSMMILSDSGVDQNIISYNRVILLHGPPGTGKTSLCRALAHKLSIRLQSTFKNFLLLEINSHSLFSRWFSESGKLVTKMFSTINDIIADTSSFVCVLIDEVESLAHAREKSMSGNEPSDSIKVVNAMLTQIDQIKSRPNVLILTTSNISGAIDVAFVDRADIKQYLGPPGPNAIHQIYISCIEELVKAKIINTEKLMCENNNLRKFLNQSDKSNGLGNHLRKISIKSDGLTGRSLRKIPLLAHSLFLKPKECNVYQFIEAMDEAIEYEKKQRSYFLKSN